MQVRVAIIGPAHGLRGEMILDVRTDSAQILVAGNAFTIDEKSAKTVTIESVRSYQNRVFVKFEEIKTREDAQALRGVELFTEEHEDDDAWYPHQLRGLAALSPDGEPLGLVTDLRIGEAQDLLLIEYQGRTVMVPFVHAIVPHVDLDKGEITITPPPGLFIDDTDIEESD